MGSTVFPALPLVALCPARKHAGRALAAAGIALAVSCRVLFIARFSVVKGLVWLAHRYAETTDPAYRAALIDGAEALVAQNNVYGTRDGNFALSVAAIARSKRRGVFPRWVTPAGFLTTVAAIGGAFLKPRLESHDTWHWLVLLVGLVGVGLTLARPGRRFSGRT